MCVDDGDGKAFSIKDACQLKHRGYVALQGQWEKYQPAGCFLLYMDLSCDLHGIE